MAGLDGLTTPDYSITDDFTGGLVKELTPEPNNNQLKLLSIVPMIAACGSFFLLVMFIFVAYDARFSKNMVRTEYGYGIKPSIPSKSTETPVEPLPDGVVPQTPAVMMGAKMGKAVNRRPNIKDLIKKNITYRPSERDMIWRDQKILKRNSFDPHGDWNFPMTPMGAPMTATTIMEQLKVQADSCDNNSNLIMKRNLARLWRFKVRELIMESPYEFETRRQSQATKTDKTSTKTDTPPPRARSSLAVVAIEAMVQRLKSKSPTILERESETKANRPGKGDKTGQLSPEDEYPDYDIPTPGIHITPSQV